MKQHYKKQIIYLVNQPFNEREIKNYGIQKWINHNWSVKIFDLTSFLYPKFWNSIDIENYYKNLKEVKLFQNISEILSTLNDLEHKVIFVDLLGFSKAEIKIRREARNHGKLISLCYTTIPKNKNKEKKNYLKSLILIKNPIIFTKKLISFVKTMIKNYRIKKNYSDYIIATGSKSLLDINKKKTQVIKAHNFDYDVFLQDNQVKSNKNGNYLVFLDEAGTHHPLFVRAGIEPFMKEENYFPIINFGLDKIAKSLQLDVKIAAHPKSNYEAQKIKYKYPIFKNKTYELIRDADVVVAHSSSSLQWAVIMNKPIIIVTTDEIKNASYSSSWSKMIDSFAKILKKKVINFNNMYNIDNFNDFLNVDDEVYKLYFETYIKTKGSPEKLVWNIVIEQIENDLFN
jgi:UDP-N-acetylglucosamine transferase subunit ALG13